MKCAAACIPDVIQIGTNPWCTQRVWLTLELAYTAQARHSRNNELSEKKPGLRQYEKRVAVRSQPAALKISAATTTGKHGERKGRRTCEMTSTSALPPSRPLSPNLTDSSYFCPRCGTSCTSPHWSGNRLCSCAFLGGRHAAKGTPAV